MTPNMTKLWTVVGALAAMLLKQYKVTGHIDIIELGEWVIANWDVMGAGLLLGWQLLKRQHDISPKMMRVVEADRSAES